MINLKIRTRLSLNFASIVASVFILFSLSIYLFSSEYRHSQFVSRLEEKAFTTAKLLFEVEQVDSVLLKIIEAKDQTILYQEKTIIFNNQNQIIFDTQDDILNTYDAEILDRIRHEKRVVEIQTDREWVGVLYTEDQNEFVVISSAYDFFGFNKLKNLRNILYISLGVGMIIIVFLGWFFAGRALQPISEIVNQVSNISSQNLHLRLDEGNKKDEIAQLSQNFNSMLERVEKAFIAQKDFVANASHELRNPLTVIKSQIDIALLSPRANEEYKKLLLSLSDDINNLSSITNNLLLLAQTTSDYTNFTFVHCRIDDILWQARKNVLDRNAEYLIYISFEKEPENENQLVIFCNNVLLRNAFSNLMDNGCKFSNDHSVNVSINFEDSTIILSFSDSGIGIAEEEKENILKPFYRGQNSINFSGNGIGLSLVNNIMKIHKGSFEINSEINVGTTIKIYLPQDHSSF